MSVSGPQQQPASASGKTTRERSSSATVAAPAPAPAPAVSSATSAAAAREEETALRNRLLVSNDRRVFTLTSKFLAFLRAAESDATTLDDVEALEGQLQKEFDLYGLSLDKLRATADANARELQQYASLHQQREAQIARAQDELVRLKIELEHEKRRRSNKEEYEAIAKIINQYPTRAETQRQLQALENELASLAEQQKQLEGTTQKRRKQFALLFDCIDDLQRALRAEEDEEEGRIDGTGKRKRSATSPEEETKDKATADDPPASEAAKKRLREVEMEEADSSDPNKDTEPGEITKEVAMADGV